MHRSLPALVLLLALASPAGATVGVQFSLDDSGGNVVLADFDGVPGLEIAALNLFSGDIELLDSSGQLLGALPHPGTPSTILLARELDGDAAAELIVLWSSQSLSALAAYSFTDDSKAGTIITELWYRPSNGSNLTPGDIVAIDPLSPPEFWFFEGPTVVLVDALQGSELWRSDSDPLLPVHLVQEVVPVDLDEDGDDELMVTAIGNSSQTPFLYFVDDPNPTASPSNGTAGARATLHAAFPNPAGPEAQLSFALPQAGRARLTIYDAAGRRVRTLLDEPREAGRHQLVWDGSDDAGATVASGTYFYELRVPGQPAVSRKLLQLR